MKSTTFSLLLFFFLLMLTEGCRLNFNFTGGAPPNPALKTLSVSTFQNESSLVRSYHSRKFTEQLRDRFLSQSRLSLVDANGDIQLSGSIVDYRIDPVSIGSTTGAQQSRMIVKVHVKYTNMIDSNESWEQDFSSFYDFPQSTDLSSNEEELMGNVHTQITQDIFAKSLGKW